MTAPTPPAVTLLLSFGGGEQFGAHPFAAGLPGSLGGAVDEGEFVVGEAEGDGVASGVVAGRSAELGHVSRIASTESLDEATLRVYGNGMRSQAKHDFHVDQFGGVGQLNCSCGTVTDHLTIRGARQASDEHWVDVVSRRWQNGGTQR